MLCVLDAYVGLSHLLVCHECWSGMCIDLSFVLVCRVLDGYVGLSFVLDVYVSLSCLLVAFVDLADVLGETTYQSIVSFD